MKKRNGNNAQTSGRGLIWNNISEYLIVVVGFECSRDPESYAEGSVATGRVTHAGQVKG
jgi:hypothetical protein